MEGIKVPPEVIEAYWSDTMPIKSTRLDSGLVHQTFVINFHEKDFILQQVNTHVFREATLTIENIDIVTDHLLSDPLYDLETPALVETRSGELYYEDPQNGFWRCLTFIENSHEKSMLSSPQEAYLTALAFGKFAASLSTLDAARLNMTIPNFHDPLHRWKMYKKALENTEQPRSQVKELIDLIEEYYFILTEFSNLKVAVRVAHNDPKSTNVLFDPTNKPLAIIDLDTVMPGTPLHDFGDLVRSIASSVPEDHANVSEIFFLKEMYDALHEGYISGIASSLTDVEIVALPQGAGYIVFEQCLRFLTDYLSGNQYYKIDHPHHNLVRARNQMALLQSLVNSLY